MYPEKVKSINFYKNSFINNFIYHYIEYTHMIYVVLLVIS